MGSKRRLLWVLAFGALVMSASVTAQAATVVASGEAFAIEKTLPDVRHLWVTPEDFTRINGFVLKPEGACLDELCVPVLQDRDSEMFVSRAGQAWFNVTALARKLEQAYVADHDHRVWSFGEIPIARSSFLRSAMAPDFELPNRAGELVRLSDFRGKKVLIITWASW